MGIQFANNAVGTLASGTIIGSGTGTTLVLGTGQGAIYPTITAPNDYFYVTLQDVAGVVREIVKVTSIVGDTLTVIRAQDGTSAYASWAVGDLVEHRLTKGSILDVTNPNHQLFLSLGIF